MSETRELLIKGRYLLPAQLLSVQFSRSGGPGGQNVNKVASKVDLRLDLEGAEEILGSPAIARIRRKLSNRLDAEGKLQILSSEHREQARNLQAALVRMQNLIEDALTIQKPRKPTRPTRGSKERRLAEKKQRSERKRLRGRIDD